MNFIALYLLFFIQLLKAEFSFSFITSPFQYYRLQTNDKAKNCLNNIKYFIQSLSNNKDNKEFQKLPILEIPIELVENWEEGEIPWDFVDNDNFTTSNNSLNNAFSSIDTDKIAFLLI
jgi:hypothetical protein